MVEFYPFSTEINDKEDILRDKYFSSFQKIDDIFWRLHSVSPYQTTFFHLVTDSQGLSTPDCSACDPRSKMHLRIDNVLVADNKTEWRSLAKTKDSMLQEINITINFPQVYGVTFVCLHNLKTFAIYQGKVKIKPC